MPRKMVAFSDLSGQIVPQDKEATIIVRNHPMLTEVVQLDASLTEVKPLLDAAGEFVVLDITADGETKQVVTELAQFNMLFKDDPYQALANAQPVKAARVGNGTRSNTGELAKIREWAASQGIEVAPKGRVKAEVVDAYRAAQAA